MPWLPEVEYLIGAPTIVWRKVLGILPTRVGGTSSSPDIEEKIVAEKNKWTWKETFSAAVDIAIVVSGVVVTSLAAAYGIQAMGRRWSIATEGRANDAALIPAMGNAGFKDALGVVFPPQVTAVDDKETLFPLAVEDQARLQDKALWETKPDMSLNLAATSPSLAPAGPLISMAGQGTAIDAIQYLPAKGYAVVFYHIDNQLFAQKVNENGAIGNFQVMLTSNYVNCGSIYYCVNYGSSHGGSNVLLLSTGDLVLAWGGDSTGTRYLQKVDPSTLNFVGSPVTLSPSGDPSDTVKMTALDNGDFVVGWRRGYCGAYYSATATCGFVNFYDQNLNLLGSYVTTNPSTPEWNEHTIPLKTSYGVAALFNFVGMGGYPGGCQVSSSSGSYALFNPQDLNSTAATFTSVMSSCSMTYAAMPIGNDEYTDRK